MMNTQHISHNCVNASAHSLMKILCVRCLDVVLDSGTNWSGIHDIDGDGAGELDPQIALWIEIPGDHVRDTTIEMGSIASLLVFWGVEMSMNGQL